MMQVEEDVSISKHVIAERLHQCTLAFNSFKRREIKSEVLYTDVTVNTQVINRDRALEVN